MRVDQLNVGKKDLGKKYKYNTFLNNFLQDRFYPM